MNGIVSRLFGGKTFAHGVHPPEHKEETQHLRIHQLPFPPIMHVPLSQHIGNPALPIVEEGDEVKRGQMIAEPDGFLSVAIHAPASGVIRKFGLMPTISGKMLPGFYLEPFAASTQEVQHGPGLNVETSTAEQIITAIQRAGLVGLGGAGFPTHAKIKVPEGKRIDTLVINGAECEPYLTADHRMMLEHAPEITLGILFLLKASGAKRAVIAVEANKADAAESLRSAIASGQPITVEVLPVKYPQGAEKILIAAVLGREIPSGRLPVDVHALCVNVSTASEIGMLLPHGTGLQERVVTVGGPAIKKKGNYRIPIGTTLRSILETVGTKDDLSTVMVGGPMMGTTASSLEIPVTKGTTGVLGFSQSPTGLKGQPTQYPCIHCGYCVDACPLFLNPSKLGLLAERRDYTSMVEQFRLMDCFECGCCSFVCPSHIPLVQQFRVSKVAIRKRREETR